MSFADQIRQAWIAALEADSPQACDAAVQNFLLLVVRKARGNFNERKELTGRQLIKDLRLRPLAALFRRLGAAVCDRYDGRFAAAALQLEQLAQAADKLKQKHAWTRIACRAHAFTWAAACCT